MRVGGGVQRIEITERQTLQLPLTGGCQCSKLRYEISEAPQLVYTCHCTDCQRMTSSAFSMGIVIADRAFPESPLPSLGQWNAPPTAGV